MRFEVWVQVPVEEAEWTWVGLAPRWSFSEHNLLAWADDDAAEKCVVVVQPDVSGIVVKAVLEKWIKDCQMVCATTLREWWASTVEPGEEGDEIPELVTALRSGRTRLTAEKVAEFIVDNDVPFSAEAREQIMEAEPADEGEEDAFRDALAKSIAEEVAAVEAAVANEGVGNEDEGGDVVGVETDEGSGASWNNEFERELKRLLGEEALAADEPRAAAAVPTRVLHGIPVTAMPEIAEGRPIDEDEPDLAVSAFPSAFNEGIADLRAARIIGVGEAQYWTHMFMQDDWAVSTHPRIPFWVLDRRERERIGSMKNFYIKRTKGVRREGEHRRRGTGGGLAGLGSVGSGVGRGDGARGRGPGVCWPAGPFAFRSWVWPGRLLARRAVGCGVCVV